MLVWRVGLSVQSASLVSRVKSASLVSRVKCAVC